MSLTFWFWYVWCTFGGKGGGSILSWSVEEFNDTADGDGEELIVVCDPEIIVNEWVEFRLVSTFKLLLFVQLKLLLCSTLFWSWTLPLLRECWF